MIMSLYTTYLHHAGFDSFCDGLSFMYSHGVRKADIIDAEFEEVPIVLYREYLHNAGMTINSLVSVKDIASKDDNIRKRNIAMVKGYIDSMEKYNIKYLMTAPAVAEARSKEEFYDMRERMCESFSDLAEYAKEANVKVCIENQSVTTRPDSKIEDISYILRNVPSLGFVLDVGNFFCVGDDVLTAYDLFNDKIVYSHFKDWKYDEYGCYVRENMPRFSGCAIGDGILPLSELSEKLIKDKKDIAVTLEINSPNINSKVLKDSADFLRDILRLSRE